jgi:hypothetical protein
LECRPVDALEWGIEAIRAHKVWSRSTTIHRDIAASRLVPDNAAKDVSSLSCSASADDNNVWGEGRLDAFGVTAESPLP